ncbi:response regulator [Halobacillus sp. A5]|uniref:response regulator n=1 Tax=Halobacillus sp. A5 TaxID=2880263 RepID=UPI0020A68ABA|nr:response regulator [Halobacillus sp. A5]
MIIDDSLFMRNWLTSILEAHSFKVTVEADNGVEGIIQYAEHLPDVVLLDVVMPRMSGTKTLEELLRQHPEAKVIICSSVDDQQQMDLCAKIGAFDFVQKPFFERIPSILERVLAQSS